MPPSFENAVRGWGPPVHLLPVEILSIIFMLVVDFFVGEYRVRLMLVCRRWCAIMLSTPAIPSHLWITKSTTMERVRAAVQGAKWLLYVTINITDESITGDFNADAFEARIFMTAIEAASKWNILFIHSLPRPGTFKAVQPIPLLKNLKSFSVSPRCDIGDYFELLMTAITTTTTSQLTDMKLHNLKVVLYLVQPDCLHVFCSLTSLTILLPQRMERHANILPSLKRLMYFKARHLRLPFYPIDTPLPLVQTLRYLFLESVSVQWMAGKAFPSLCTCSIIFPHQTDTICNQPVSMPACAVLEYDSNDLDPLGYFHDLPFANLTIKSGQWNVMRGNRALVAVCNTIAPHAQSMTRLDIQVRCSQKLLTCMLSLLPALEYLILRLASPRALNEKFFRAFVATKSNADSPHEMGTTPHPPHCVNLVRLELDYKRWLRGSERTALLLVFGDIVSSRGSEEGLQLRLRFEGLPPDWFVSRHVESIREVDLNEPLVIGISSPLGITPLVMSGDSPLVGAPLPWKEPPLEEVPFKEAEYLVARRQLSVGCLITLHHLVELRVGGENDILPSDPPSDLPLFNTLRVLEAENIHPSFLAGQTFQKLERCRISVYGGDPKLSDDQVTQMPVCTRLDVDDLTLLATLKLPQIREMGVSFNHPEFNMIWKRYIAVNANLSGLELLHVHGWHKQADLLQVLRCLPVLKTLILANGSDLDAVFFREFVPTHSNETTGLTQSHDEAQIPRILCPALSSVLIEGCGPTERVELIPILEQVVTLRAACGSVFEKFTLSAIEFGRKCELIGSQGAFVAEMDSPGEDAKPFKLHI